MQPYPLFPFEPVPGRSGFGTFSTRQQVQAWELARESGGEEAGELLKGLEVGTRHTLYKAAREAGDDAKAKEILISLSNSDSFFWGHPQFLAYPDSIEQVRLETQRYNPPYPVYNHNTLVKNFILKTLPATKDACESITTPVYWHAQHGDRIAANKKRGPFSVYPWKPGKSIRLNIGKLDPRSTYAVRVIATLLPADAAAYKQTVFELTVNDKPDGSDSTYILRGRACDNFYEVVNLMFHGAADREFVATLRMLDESDSAVLYAYNIDVHNVFGECANRPGKIRATLTESGPSAGPVADESARVARDRDLWYSLPPLNVSHDNRKGRQQASGGFAYKHEWDRPWRMYKGKSDAPADTYTWEDLAARKPLPGVGDCGYGVKTAAGAYRSAIGHAVFERYRLAGRTLRDLSDKYQKGDLQAGRDGAFLLARLAYQLPAIKPLNALIQANKGTPESPFRRYGPGSDAPSGWEATELRRLVMYYDQLFYYIDGNEELAAAIGRYIPWVRTPRDLKYLYDVYILQYTANEMLHHRYFYDHELAEMVIAVAVAENDNAITKPCAQRMGRPT